MIIIFIYCIRKKKRAGIVEKHTSMTHLHGEVEMNNRDKKIRRINSISQTADLMNNDDKINNGSYGSPQSLQSSIIPVLTPMGLAPISIGGGIPMDTTPFGLNDNITPNGQRESQSEIYGAVGSVINMNMNTIQSMPNSLSTTTMGPPPVPSDALNMPLPAEDINTYDDDDGEDDMYGKGGNDDDDDDDMYGQQHVTTGGGGDNDEEEEYEYYEDEDAYNDTAGM